METEIYRLYATDSEVYYKESNSISEINAFKNNASNNPELKYIQDSDIWSLKKKKAGWTLSIEKVNYSVGWGKSNLSGAMAFGLGKIIIRFNRGYEYIKNEIICGAQYE